MAQGMQLDRSIAAGPRRKVEQVCEDLADFVAELASERGHGDSGRVRSDVVEIFPPLRYLLARRLFADPAISIRMPELTVLISVSYDMDGHKDLDIPSLQILEKLPGAAIDVSLHATEALPESQRRVLETASTGRVRFHCPSADDHASQAGPDQHGQAEKAPERPDPGPVQAESVTGADIVKARIVDPTDAVIVDARIVDPEDYTRRLPAGGAQ